MSEIQYEPAYRVGDKLCSNLQEAKVSAISNLLSAMPEEQAKTAADLIVDQETAVLAILKQKERVRTRKPSTRKRKATAAPAPTTTSQGPVGCV